jgi:hypothetical protein
MNPRERLLVLNAVGSESGYESPDDSNLPLVELGDATDAEGIATAFFLTKGQDSSFFTLYIRFRASTNTEFYSYCTLTIKPSTGKHYRSSMEISIG